MKTFIDIGTNQLQGFEKIKNIESIDDSWFKIFIEPNPECWEIIEQKLKAYSNYTFHKKALYTDTTNIELITRADKSCDTAATVLGESFIKDSLARWQIQVQDFKTYVVETITFETLFEDIEGDIIIKLDAEGIEFLVLEYLLQCTKNIKRLYCEFHIHNLEDSLRKDILIDSLSKRFQVIEWE